MGHIASTTAPEQGSAVVVIGASSGVGAAVVRAVAPLFDRVYGLSRRGSLPADVEGICSAGILDVRDFDQVAASLSKINNECPIQALIGCFGVGFYAPLDEAVPEAWREMCETNLLGLIHVLAVLQQSLASCRHFVHIGSLSANRPSRTPGSAIYRATKVATRTVIEDFRTSARGEGRDLRLTLVSPGFIGDTDFAERFYSYRPEAARPMFEAFSPLAPGDVALVVRQVLTDLSQVEVSEVSVRSPGQPD